MAERLRVAVVGLGFGQAHLAAYLALADRFEVTVVCDREPDRLRAAGWFTGPEPASSLEEVLGRDDVDVVDLCTPPTTHAELTRRALAAGHHVICEKPLAGSLREVDALAALEAESPGVVMPVFQYRFGNGAARLRHLLDRDLTGRPFVASVETFWSRGAAYYASPWRGRLATELGGVCAMHAIHAHDLLTDLLGPVRSVMARTATRVNDVETEDCAAAVVEFTSGALATLTATLGSARELSRLRLHFEHLSVESGLAPYAGGSEPWTFEPATPEAAARIDAAFADVGPGRSLLERQLELFAEAIDAGDPPPVTIADARTAIELLTAIYRSSAEGRPVTLPLGPDDPAYDGWAGVDGSRIGSEELD